VNNYIKTADTMRNAPHFTKVQVMAAEKIAARHLFKQVAARIDDSARNVDPKIPQSILEQIDKILFSHPASSKSRIKLTKLYVKFFTKSGDYQKAKDHVAKHIQDILAEGAVEVIHKQNFLSLLKLEAKIFFEEGEYDQARVTLMSALKVCAEYQFDPVQLYAELASTLFANDHEDEDMFQTINNTIGFLENGHLALYRSPYFKTVSCGTRYESDGKAIFYINLKPKNSNLKHYFGVCHFGHTDENIEIEPVSKQLNTRAGSNLVTFEKEVPLPKAGRSTEVHIMIYADQSSTTSISSHFQILAVLGKSFSGNDLEQYFGI